jgi:hypothetical protein
VAVSTGNNRAGLPSWEAAYRECRIFSEDRSEDLELRNASEYDASIAFVVLNVRGLRADLESGANGGIRELG